MVRGGAVAGCLSIATLAASCSHRNPDFSPSSSEGGSSRGDTGSTGNPSAISTTPLPDTSADPTSAPGETGASDSMSTLPPTSDSSASAETTDGPKSCEPPPPPVDIRVIEEEGVREVECTDIMGPVLGEYRVEFGTLILDRCLNCDDCLVTDTWEVTLDDLPFPSELSGCGQLIMFYEGPSLPACTGWSGLMLKPPEEPAPNFYLTNNRDLPPPLVGEVDIVLETSCPVPPNGCPPDGSGDYALELGIRTIPQGMTREVNLAVPGPVGYNVTNHRSVIAEDCSEHITWSALLAPP